MKIAKNFTLALLFMAFAASYAADIENAALYQVGAPGAIDANGTWSLSSGGEAISDNAVVDYATADLKIGGGEAGDWILSGAGTDGFTVKSIAIDIAGENSWARWTSHAANGSYLDVTEDFTIKGNFSLSHVFRDGAYYRINVGGSLNLVSRDDRSSVTNIWFGQTESGGNLEGYGGGSLLVDGDINIGANVYFKTNSRFGGGAFGTVNMGGDATHSAKWTMDNTTSETVIVYMNGLKSATDNNIIELNVASHDSDSFTPFNSSYIFCVKDIDPNASERFEFSGKIISNRLGDITAELRIDMILSGTQIIRTNQTEMWKSQINASEGTFLLGASGADSDITVAVAHYGKFGAVSDVSVSDGAADIGRTIISALEWRTGAGGIVVNVDGTESSSLHIKDSVVMTGEEFAFYFEGDLDGEGHVGNIFTWDSDNGSIGDAVENAVNSGYLKAYLNGVFCESADFAIEGNSLGVALNVPEAAEFAAVLGVIGFAFVLRRRKK